MADDQRAPQWGDDPAGITKQELLSTAVGVFVMGCLVGWALFGKPAQLKAFLQSGNLAEWAAAAGALVVGVMAWRIATQNHRHHVATADALRERDKIRSINEMLILLNELKQVREACELFDTEKDWTKARIISRTGILLVVVRQCDWSERVVTLMDPSALTQLNRSRVRVLIMCDMAEQARQLLGTSDSKLPEAAKLMGALVVQGRNEVKRLAGLISTVHTLMQAMVDEFEATEMQVDPLP